MEEVTDRTCIWTRRPVGQGLGAERKYERPSLSVSSASTTKYTDRAAQTAEIHFLTILEAANPRPGASGLVSPEACPHVALALSARTLLVRLLFSGHQCCWTGAHPYDPFSLSDLLKGSPPNVVTLGARASTCEFWGHTIESLKGPEVAVV